MVVIGDSPSEIIGAKSINAIACAALWGPSAKEESLVSAGAEVYFYDLIEFENWLVSNKN